MQIIKTKLSYFQAGIFGLSLLLSLFTFNSSMLEALFLFIFIVGSVSRHWSIYLSILILVFGSLAKLEHWWWASYALILGMLVMILSIVFLAVKQKRHWTFKLFLLSTILVLIGALLKLEHYWMASYVLILGLFIILLSYLIRFVLKPKKNVYDISKCSVVASILFYKLMHLEHYNMPSYLLIIHFLILLIFTILSFIDIAKNRIFTS